LEIKKKIYNFAPPKDNTMKKNIHPENYRTVVFRDISVNESWLGRSTAHSRENISWEDGNEYPLVKVEISNRSHPYFTGQMKFVDTAGRIDKFNKKFSKFSKS
jgi:large subunit ribosomal protein L31